MMKLNIVVLVNILCALLLEVNGAYVVKRDTPSTPPNIFESFQTNMDMFRKCLDLTLAKSVDDVNVHQLKPVFNVIGDQINRFSKAFEDLTAKSTTTQESIWA
ncbi:uncharacterized protein LOC114246518 [Bombyx mandarina]|uniref:Uncharacterized protein LOC114246518 n=1 Tax=Bombyx mandarina TaxID=7092 RepID=A0A6J2JZL7_BOMMA|nr:uncharacterized protein LOC114246518 [Bombyx mandarina]